MVPLQQNLTVEIGLLESKNKTWQLWSRNLRMYMYVWCSSRSTVMLSVCVIIYDTKWRKYLFSSIIILLIIIIKNISIALPQCCHVKGHFWCTVEIAHFIAMKVATHNEVHMLNVHSKHCENMNDVWHDSSFKLGHIMMCGHSEHTNLYCQCLRSSACGNFIVSRTRLHVTEKAFSIAWPRAWNSLPSDMKLISSRISFRKKLKTLFQSHVVELF